MVVAFDLASGLGTLVVARPLEMVRPSEDREPWEDVAGETEEETAAVHA